MQCTKWRGEETSPIQPLRNCNVRWPISVALVFAVCTGGWSQSFEPSTKKRKIIIHFNRQCIWMRLFKNNPINYKACSWWNIKRLVYCPNDGGLTILGKGPNFSLGFFIKWRFWLRKIFTWAIRILFFSSFVFEKATINAFRSFFNVFLSLTHFCAAPSTKEKQQMFFKRFLENGVLENISIHLAPMLLVKCSF